LLAFQLIVKEATKHLKKGGRDAMKIASAANNDAKKELGDNADAKTLANKAIKLLEDNFDKYKRQAGV
jgi:hypothetical protein